MPQGTTFQNNFTETGTERGHRGELGLAPPHIPDISWVHIPGISRLHIPGISRTYIGNFLTRDTASCEDLQGHLAYKKPHHPRTLQ